mmetsp:Transcript_55790/g.97789  ORF Transcript_55790/g.97789 Transcript_55790/m.97789 type:complete len:247 (+) Transcript_55790:864-1604(+)
MRDTNLYWWSGATCATEAPSRVMCTPFSAKATDMVYRFPLRPARLFFAPAAAKRSSGVTMKTSPIVPQLHRICRTKCAWFTPRKRPSRSVPTTVCGTVVARPSTVGIPRPFQAVIPIQWLPPHALLPSFKVAKCTRGAVITLVRTRRLDQVGQSLSMITSTLCTALSSIFRTLTVMNCPAGHQCHIRRKLLSTSLQMRQSLVRVCSSPHRRIRSPTVLPLRSRMRTPTVSRPSGKRAMVGIHPGLT